MLHNSGAFGPCGSSVDVDTPSLLADLSAPRKSDENSQSSESLGQEQFKAMSEGTNLPVYREPTHETSNVNSNMDTFPTYFNRNLAEFYGSSNSANHDIHLQNGVLPLTKQVKDTPTPNVQLFSSFNEEMNKNVKMNESGEEGSHWRNNMDSFNAYNRNKERFSHFSEGFDSVNEKVFTLDSNKRKSIENTVKIIENMISSSTNEKKIERDNTNKLTNNLDETSDSNTVINDVTEDQTSKKLRKTKKSKKSKEKNSLKKDKNKANKNKKKEKAEKSVKVEKPVKVEINKDKKTQSDQEEYPDNETFSENVNLEIYFEDIMKDTSNDKGYMEVAVTNVHLKDSSGNIEIFNSDINIVPKDEVDPEKVINLDKSVAAATEFIRNNVTSEAFLECPYCNNMFKHWKRFLIHVKWHTFGLVNDTRTEMARQRQLQKQQKRDALLQKKDEQGEAFKCKDCDQLFMSKSSLRNHRSRAHSNMERTCIICGETAIGQAALTAHMQKHAGPLACPTCQKVYSNRYTLAKHMDSHKEKQLSCEECGKMFGSMNQVRAHVRVHERVARGHVHRCSYCGKGFYDTYNLQIHERTHRNEKPFSCEKCNSSFVTNSSLKRHIRVSHNSLKPFECMHCSRGFQSQKTLDVHLAKLHADLARETNSSKKNNKKLKRELKEEIEESDAQDTSE